METENRSALEIYMSRVFKIIILAIPTVGLCAGLTYTIIKLLGFYPTVSGVALGLFDVSNFCYFIIGYLIQKKCEDKNGVLKPKAVFIGKALICVIEFVQWNYLSYMIPGRGFWAYSVFFVMLCVFFLDSKYLAIIIVEIVGSMAVSWVLCGETLLPIRDEFFIPNMILRGVFIVFSMVCLWIICFSIQKHMVKELEKIADYDTLTMLRNRRGLHKKTEEILMRVRSGSPLSVLMCDLDEFKTINDTYGHNCGDEILKNTANVILHTVGREGNVFRYGGEEILIYLYEDKKSAVSLAERLRENVAASSVDYEGKAISITLTIGVATYGERYTEMDALFKCADANLYYGKNHGKNQVVV